MNFIFDYSRRRNALKERLLSLRLDGMLLASAPNVHYLSGFTGEASALLVSPAGELILTDFRYLEQARKECTPLRVEERKVTLVSAAIKEARRLGLKRIGFEAKHVSQDVYTRLLKEARGAQLVPADDEVEKMRMVKEEGEITLIREAIRVAEESLLSVKRRLRPGVREKDFANLLEFEMKKRGAQCASFPIIAAFGERSSLPHAPATERALKGHDSVIIDWGSRVSCYNCDLTRTGLSHRMPREVRKVYEVVYTASRRALEAVRAGRELRYVDRAARSYIESKGYGRYFGHGLGHGVGLEVHEAPAVNRKAGGKLLSGMVLTVEPGIYLAGKFGVRIEEMVRVTQDGCEMLTTLDARADKWFWT